MNLLGKALADLTNVIEKFTACRDQVATALKNRMELNSAIARRANVLSDAQAIISMKDAPLVVEQEARRFLGPSSKPTRSVVELAPGFETVHVDSGKCIEQLCEIFGVEWLASMLEEKPPAKGFMRPQSSHEFCEYYFHYCKNPAAAMQGGQYLTQRELACHVVAARNIRGFDRLLVDLKNPDNYRDAVSEAIFANYFLRTADAVEFQYPTSVRTSDLVVTVGPSRIHAECKRVREFNSIFERARRLYPDAIQSIKSQISRRADRMSIFVRFNKEPTRPAFEHIIATAATVASTDGWSLGQATEDYQLWSKRASKVDGADLAPLTTLSSKTLYAVPEITIDDGNIIDQRVIAFEIECPPLSTKAFLRQIESGIDQLLEAGPGFIGVEIPDPRTPGELEQYVGAVRSAFDRGKWSRVNAVYLFWISAAREALDVDGQVVERLLIRTTGRKILNLSPKAAASCP